MHHHTHTILMKVSNAYVDQHQIVTNHGVECAWCKDRMWQRVPVVKMSSTQSIERMCDDQQVKYPWILVHPTGKGGVLETYYHYMLEFAVPLSMKVLHMVKTDGTIRSGLVVLHDTRTALVESQVRKWGWLDLLPVNFTFMHRLTNRVCADSIILDIANCNPLAPPNQRMSRILCVNGLRRVGLNAVARFEIERYITSRASIESSRNILFIAREQFLHSRTRKIKNWSEVIDTITTHAMRLRLTFHLACFNDIPLKEQIASLRMADIVITQRGSANANFIVLRPETKVILLADPINPPYEPFHWIGPLWYNSTVTHIKGGNFDPYGVVNIADLARTLSRVQPISNGANVALPMRNHH